MTDVGIMPLAAGCLVLGLIYIGALRLLETLVLMPKIGFVFSFLFTFVPIALFTGTIGGACLLIFTGATGLREDLNLDQRLHMVITGAGILLLLTKSNWEQLLEKRKQQTGSAAIPVSKVGKTFHSIFDVVGVVFVVLFHTSLALGLIAYVAYTFILRR